jgi:hypothetical protein
MLMETLKGGELYYHIKTSGRFSSATARSLFV